MRKEAADLVALLTPIIKAFLTDNAFESTNHAMQIYGGHGFISEWGMEQYVRDARINMIYEGTNSIQSLDLLGRKVLGDMGAKLKKFGKLVTEFAEAEGVKPEMAEFINPLADIGDKVQKLTMEIGMKAMQNPDEVGAAAVPYLRTVGHPVLNSGAHGAPRTDKEASGDPFYKSKLATARFYFARLLPETASTICGARRFEDADGSRRIAVLTRVRAGARRAARTQRFHSLRRAAPTSRAARHYPETSREQFPDSQGRRAGRRRDGRADRRAPHQRARAGAAVRPAGQGRPENAIALKAIENLKKLSPAPFGVKDDAKYLEAANYEDDIAKLAECDVVIEAIAERMDWKHDLYKKVAPHIAPNAIFATNTSACRSRSCPKGSRTS